MPTVLVQQNSDEAPQAFEIKEGKVLYEQLEEQGLSLPHGCLAGSCGACRIEILEGADQLMPPSAVEADTIEFLKGVHPGKEIRLSCRAKVIGNIKIAPLK